MEKYLPGINKTPLITTVRLDCSIEELFSCFLDRPDTALLNSSLGSDAGRFSFIGLNPFLILSTKGHDIKLTFNGHKLLAKGDPFEYLEAIINTYRTENTSSLPFTAGGIGYLSYDIKDILEKLPEKAKDDLNLPDIYFVFYQVILIYDSLNPGRIFISILDVDTQDKRNAGTLMEEIKGIIKKAGDSIEGFKDAGNRHACSLPIETNFTKSEYIDSIKKVIEYIKAGDIYQACLSQRFKTKWNSSPYELYLRLNEINPAPFSSFLNFNPVSIISSSPELFLRVKDGMVETRPMKGTRPRGKTNEEDEILRKDLIKAPKDASELAMIVDLERNDLGRISVPGSVEVTEHKRIETYPTVFQSISVIKSKIEKDTGLIDIIKAMSPGGSITGCPKIRAMEIIDELEPTKRSVYTGNIGYISFHDTMDLNIAIRTMLMKGNDIYFQAGGGIVADSDPESEYNETMDKAKALIDSLSLNGQVEGITR